MLLAVLMVALSGCTTLTSSNGKGYVSPSAQVVLLDSVERPDPVSAPGKDLAGKPIDFGGHSGQVVVINVWETECVECRIEAPMLVKLAEELSDVVFLGINIRDPDPAIGRGFEREFELPYPSYFDPNGEVLLTFPDQVNPRAIPTTILLDKEARPAAVIYGAIPSEKTLRDLIAEVAGA